MRRWLDPDGSAAYDALKNAWALRYCHVARCPGGEFANAFDAETAAFALIEHKEHTNMKPKNTICLWFDKERA